MPRLHKIFVLSLLLTPWSSLFGQIKDIGLPAIINHERVASNAGTQNWDITQSSRGFMYFANNDGILEFDGTGWNVYPMPNSSVVRSVLAIGDTIYAGAFEEIGYLAPNNKGSLAWHSLNHLLPEEYSRFAEVWNVFHDNGRILFQSFEYVIIYENGTVKVVEPPSTLSLMHQAGERLFVADKENGLLVFEGNGFRVLSDHPVFFQNEIRFVLPFGHNEYIIGTSNDGVFVWDGKRLVSWETGISNQLIQDNLYSASKLSGGEYAFGTIRNGLYITDASGRLLQHINRYKGLQNNTVLSLFEDRRNNLWLGLDNGIDYAELSSPLSFINYNYNIESSYASIIFNDILYVGTNQGLYAAQVDNLTYNLHPGEIFTLISGTEGQVWSLQIIDNTLLCGHNFGCFQIEGFNARKISDIRGFWSFLEAPGLNNAIIAGTYTGLIILKKENGKWQFHHEVEGFQESCRTLFIDKDDKLWIAHGYRGLFNVNLSPCLTMVENASHYFDNHGLPNTLPYNLQIVNNEMLVTTHEGIFRYDRNNDVFMIDEEFTALFGEVNFIDKIHQDKNANLWYFTDDHMGVLRLLEDGTFRNITAPFNGLNDHLIPAFQHIFISKDQHVFIGSQNGLVHYDHNIIKDYNYCEDVYFTNIVFHGRHEPVSINYFSDVLHKPDHASPRKAFALNSVTFRFTTPAFENPHKLKFSWRLKGLEEQWSGWKSLNFKEYTNLREGHYVFEVKARNAFGTESPVKEFHFSVAPPLLRSNAAYVVYVILILAIIAVNTYYVRRRILRIRLRERLKHEKRLARREQIFQEKTALSEKEIVHLRNESLQNEMKHKNKELANATLHLIQKNKALTGLKNELNQILKNLPDDNPERYNVKQLLKKVNKDLHNENNWELFNSYFDEVHQDFLDRFKKEHTDLSPKELRLCAYLRMNISTKEIAPLMNISVRGVEISRYRLRKKLQIDHNTNLAEYILSF